MMASNIKSFTNTTTTATTASMAKRDDDQATTVLPPLSPTNNDVIQIETTLVTASCHGLLEPSCFSSSSSSSSSTSASSSSSKKTKPKPKNQLLTSASTHVRGAAGGGACSGGGYCYYNNTNNKKHHNKYASNNPRNTLARQKRNSWMRSSVVRRVAAVVDEEVAALCEKSPFLNSVASSAFLSSTATAATTTTTTASTSSSSSTTSSASSSEIAYFDRSEIHLGKALGRGGFAEVYAVERLDLKEDNNNDNTNNNEDDEVTVHQTQLRRKMQTNVMNSSSSSSGGGSGKKQQPVYAIKFLRKKLLSNTRQFQRAAIDLAVEAQYLAALQQSPYIIKIHGLTRGGTSAFSSARHGKHDNFFIIMDYLHETLDHRIQRWQQRQNNNNNKTQHQLQTQSQSNNYPPHHYHSRTLTYAYQIAQALSYLHDKQIVYRDLKPQNLGFRERDVIQIFDFGLCRELPKPKGQSHREEDLEDEETFHMSNVGTQRYMGPEIIMTRRYNAKADVYSWSMVALEMLTWNKPFSEYNPEEHKLNVAKWGERPRLLETMSEKEETTDDEYCSAENKDQRIDEVVIDMKCSNPKRKRAKIISTANWPAGMASLLQDAWTQDVADRLPIQSVLERIKCILAADNASETPQNDEAVHGTHISKKCINLNSNNGNSNEEVVLEFPSHFTPVHTMLGHSRQEQYEREQQQDHDEGRNDLNHNHQFPASPHRDDSEQWFGDRQSDASNSLLELTMTSASTTMHDSSSLT